MFGQRIERLRIERNLTQQELAERVGITQGYLSQLEMGIRQPSLPVLKRLAEKLGCTAADLLLEQPTTEVGPAASEPATAAA